ncbi:MAG: biotin synthase BioB, partial [Candidatus Binatia bacterium]
MALDFGSLAEKSLRGEILDREEMKEVLDAFNERLPELLEAAFRVRHHYFGKRVQIHVLKNIKSGLCPEDCHYCSQS